MFKVCATAVLSHIVWVAIAGGCCLWFSLHALTSLTFLQAWRQGATGYPLVDAGMLELWSTGWLHNRLRVVCASFLVKNLLLPWQWGLKHFWDTLLDADIESDVLGFQYVSGCLLDAHPFRLYPQFAFFCTASCTLMCPFLSRLLALSPCVLPSQYISYVLPSKRCSVSQLHARS